MRHGHNLDMQRVNDEVVVVCKCGKWQVLLPATPDVDLVTLVAQAVNQHEKHLDSLNRRYQDGPQRPSTATTPPRRSSSPAA
jgi:hypothetical protein